MSPPVQDEEVSVSCSEYSESGVSSVGGQSRGSGVSRKAKLVCVECGRVARTSGPFCTRCRGELVPCDAQGSTPEKKGKSLGGSAPNEVGRVPPGAAAPSLPTVTEEVETRAGQSGGGVGTPPPKDCSDEDRQTQPASPAQIVQSLLADAGRGHFFLSNGARCQRRSGGGSPCGAR